MPLLIRIIAQRVAIFVLSSLAFLGVNPEIDIPTDEEVQQTQEDQREIVRGVLSPNTDKVGGTLQEVEEEVEKIVEKVVKTQQETQKAVESIANIPQIENTGTGLATTGSFLDDVVVNIICVNRSTNLISLTTGSGVIVSPSGLVLTNSHVANSFLFDDKGSLNRKDCSIRRENIPTYGFNAELVYLPSDWLIENQGFFVEDNPRGSGENDYALLAITSNTNPALSIPESFNYATLITDEDLIDEGKEVVVSAYPGTQTGVFEVDSNAKLRKSESKIAGMATFNRTTIDIISTEPNVVAKRGSSGGGLFMNEGLLGIITTTDGYGPEAYLNALTIPYILRDFRSDTGEEFNNFIFKSKDSLISDFENVEEYLKGLISSFL